MELLAVPSAGGIVRAAKVLEAPVDILIYPAVFAFRHGIELYLKHLLTRLQTLNGTAEWYVPSHQLTDTAPCSWQR